MAADIAEGSERRNLTVEFWRIGVTFFPVLPLCSSPLSSLRNAHCTYFFVLDRI
jgi:hypothetical protein